MREIAIVLLTLPDGRIVLQRRDKTTDISPGLLGFFGGHIEAGESPAQAVARELEEETSLKAADTNLQPLADYQLTVPIGGRDETVSYHLFSGSTPHADFDVFEGEKAEAHTKEDLLARDDLTASTRHVLTTILNDK